MQGWEKTASRRRRYTSQGLIKRTTRVHSSRDSTGRGECNINIFRVRGEDMTRGGERRQRVPRFVVSTDKSLSPVPVQCDGTTRTSSPDYEI